MERNNSRFKEKDKPCFSIAAFIKELLLESGKTSWVLFKIMIPVSIIVKILQETDFITIIGHWLSPAMSLTGLPGEMGIVWASGIIANLFGGIIAFMNIAPELNLSVAQVTVITVMMLVAHSFPIELQIARKSGIKLLPMFLWRFGMAIVLGMLLHFFYKATGLHAQKAALVLTAKAVEKPGLVFWILNELKNYAIIYCFITGLMLVIKILKATGVINLITRTLHPVLRFLGIGGEVMTITIIGLTLGIVYGGALIIAEAQSGNIQRRDIFYSLCMMGICHSLIEDTILMMSLGGHYSGVLIARVVFTLLVMLFLVKITSKLSDEKFEKLFLIKQ